MRAELQQLSQPYSDLRIQILFSVFHRTKQVFTMTFCLYDKSVCAQRKKHQKFLS